MTHFMGAHRHPRAGIGEQARCERKRAAPGGPPWLWDSAHVRQGGGYSSSASSSPYMVGPESWPLASVFRSTNSMTAMGAMSP